MENRNREQEVKARTIDSIMRHPKLSRVISDAASAPIGSTKRKQATAAISIINKMNRRFDGQGGPGVGGVSQSTPQFSFGGIGIPTTSTGTPQKQTTIGRPSMPIPGKTTTTGGVTRQEYTLPSGRKTTVIISAAPAKRTYAPNSFPDLVQKVSPGIQKFGLGMDASVASLMGQASAFPLTAVRKGYEGFKNVGNWITGNPQEKIPALKLEEKISGFGTPLWQAYEKMPWKSGQPVVSRPTTQPTATAQPTQTNEQAGNDAAQQTTQGAPGQTQEGSNTANSGSQTDGTTRSTSYSGGAEIGLPGGPQSQTTGGPSIVQNAVAQNMGPAAFAYQAMADKEKLRALFPGVRDEDLPWGASLAGHMDKLSETLKGEMNLDLIGNELAAKTKAGVTIENDLWAYTRGKDEILNSVEGMIKDAESRFAAMDTSDPRVQAEANRYMNYLSIMKGRANQRYIDAVSTSVNQFQSELSGLESLYNDTVTRYNEAMASKGAAAQEDYNRWFTVLTDLYNQVEAAPRKEMETTLMRLQIENSRLANLQLLGAGGGGVTGEGYTPEEHKKAYDFISEIIVDKDKNFSTGAPDINSLIMQARNSGMSLSGVIAAYSNIVGDALAKETDPARRQQLRSIAEGFLGSDILSQTEQLPGGAPVVGTGKYTMAQKIYESDRSLVRQNTDLYRQALQDLAPKQWFRSGRKLTEKDGWIEDWSTQGLDKTILEKIYQNASQRGSDLGQQLDQIVSIPNEEEFVDTLLALSS